MKKNEGISFAFAVNGTQQTTVSRIQICKQEADKSCNPSGPFKKKT
jgi:hypothetical protein